MLNEQIAIVLRQKFPGPEGESAVKFLSQNFSENGQIAIASVFLYAGDVGKSVVDVLPALKRNFDKYWSYQHPDIRGDCDAPGCGGQNRSIIKDVHDELGIPFPAI